jgi:GDSL-like Lipase/Acylhydrolase family
MMRRVSFLLALLVLATLQQIWPAGAEESVQNSPDRAADCGVTENMIEANFALQHVVHAIAAKHLDILVLGAGSSLLPGSNGARDAYPARLQHALSEKLSGVEVKVTTDVKSKRSATDMVKALPQALLAAKPALVIWQTGTVDAMQAVDPDQFSQALDRGINVSRNAGADVIFINPQYSPRTESMIALGTYAENMRWVALQQEIPLFDRFGIMKFWADNGTFDLYSATKKLDIAVHVHDCIGRLLADLVVAAAKPSEPHAVGGR